MWPGAELASGSSDQPPVSDSQQESEDQSCNYEEWKSAASQASLEESTEI